MALGLNKVSLLGNLGQDPEIKSSQGGKELATFSVATTETWKDKNTGEKKENTEWHRVVVFSEGLITIIKKHLKRGAKVYLEGSLRTRKYNDASGVEKYSTEIILQGSSVFILLDNKKNIAESDDFEHMGSYNKPLSSKRNISQTSDSAPF